MFAVSYRSTMTTTEYRFWLSNRKQGCGCTFCKGSDMQAHCPKWDVGGPPTEPEAKKHTGPCICKRCKSKNDYAEPNQSDGSYICFECR